MSEKFALIDSDGIPTAFYSSEIHGDNIPAAAFMITDAQWLECLENQGRRKFIDGALVEYIPPPAPQLVPSSISDRQFFQQLAGVGIISQDEALASNAAVIPPPLLAIIDAMPIEQRFAAKMLVSGATVFERSHPMTTAIGAAYGWNDAQIDDFFRAAAQL